jgi:hypothetical protein
MDIEPNKANIDVVFEERSLPISNAVAALEATLPRIQRVQPGEGLKRGKADTE